MERVQLHKFIDLAKPVKVSPEPKAMSRRQFLAAATGVAAVSAMAPEAFARNFIDQYDPDGPIARYPNPDVMVLDKRFKYKLGNTPIVRLYRGTMWAEGPAWSGVGRYLTWSDIPNNEQLRWSEEDGHVSRQFRYPSNNSNGNFFDYQGRQVAMEHGTRRVARYTLTLQGEETITWPRGQILTERWHRRSEDGKTDAWFWLAPSMHYIPIKMRITRTSRGTLEVLLDSIRVDQDGDGEAEAGGANVAQESVVPNRTASDITYGMPGSAMAPIRAEDLHGQ